MLQALIRPAARRIVVARLARRLAAEARISSASGRSNATALLNSSSSDAHDAKRAKTDGVGPLVAPTGALVDAYRDALAPGPLPLSTHADDFAGTLDYIWHGGAGGEWAPTEVVEVLGMPYELGDAASFASIPDAQWPSDPLALGAVLQLA